MHSEADSKSEIYVDATSLECNSIIVESLLTYFIFWASFTGHVVAI